MKLLITGPCKTSCSVFIPPRGLRFEGGHMMTRLYFLIKGKYRIHKWRVNMGWRSVFLLFRCSLNSLSPFELSVYWWFPSRGAYTQEVTSAAAAGRAGEGAVFTLSQHASRVIPSQVVSFREACLHPVLARVLACLTCVQIYFPTFPDSQTISFWTDNVT